MSNPIRTALTAKLVRQCGDNLWGSCAQFPVSDWKHEVEAGDTVLGYWEWVISQAEAEGLDLQDLTPEGGKLSVLEQVAEACGWTAEGTGHARDNHDVSYGPECVLALENGREIRTPPFPGLCSYVRVVQFGYELAFWTADEFTDDAAGVLGALIGAAKGLATPQPTTGA